MMKILPSLDMDSSSSPPLESEIFLSEPYTIVANNQTTYNTRFSVKFFFIFQQTFIKFINFILVSIKTRNNKRTILHINKEKKRFVFKEEEEREKFETEGVKKRVLVVSHKNIGFSSLCSA